VLKTNTVGPEQVHQLEAAMAIIDSRLEFGEFLVDQLEQAMINGVPASLDPSTLSQPINMELFEEYNQNLDKLEALKQLIEERGINFKDYLSFRLSFESTFTRPEPINALFKGLYYYHLISWLAMFPKEKVCCTILDSTTLIFGLN